MACILILTPQIPYPPRQGTALRNWGILRGLASQHEVSLLTFAAPDQPIEIPATLSDILERVAVIPQPTRTMAERLRTLLFTPHPDMAQRLASPAFLQQLSAWLDDYAFDWVHVEGIELARYLTPVWARPHPPKVTFDDHNCEYMLQKRACLSDWTKPARWLGAAYSFVQWQRLRRYESETCQRADIVLTVSRADTKALQLVNPQLEPIILPNGIHVTEYAATEARAHLQTPAFVFTGTMDFRPNVDGVLWFVDAVWPSIRAIIPAAHFYIVGRHPHKRLEKLRQIPGITITGSVPETPPYINAATVYVVPLLVGGGSRLKILESTAMGKAIVSTTLGAEGFRDPGRAMILTDTAQDFAAACVYLAQDANARADLAQRARAFAKTYDWDVLLPTLFKRLQNNASTQS